MTKEVRIYDGGMGSLINDAGKTQQLYAKELDHYHIGYIHKYKFKMVKGLNIRPETIKLEENTSSKFFDINLSNIF